MSNKPRNEMVDMSSTTYKLLITRVYHNWRRETPEVDTASVEAGIEFVKSLAGSAAVAVHLAVDRGPVPAEPFGDLAIGLGSFNPGANLFAFV